MTSSNDFFPLLPLLAYPSGILVSSRYDTFMEVPEISLSLQTQPLWQQIYSQIIPRDEIKWDMKDYIYVWDNMNSSGSFNLVIHIWRADIFKVSWWKNNR